MLSPEEKSAGRRFRDEAQAELLQSFEANPPTHTVPNFIANFRHTCPERNFRSTALELQEMYELSPEDPEQQVPAGRFAFIWKAGRCRLCGQTARSRAGRLVDAWARPPLRGRVAR